MTHPRKDLFVEVEQELIPDAKAEHDPSEEAREDGGFIVDNVPDATGYSGSEE